MSADLKIDLPENYDFLSVVYSHPWSRLEPFGWDDNKKVLRRVELLSNGNVIRILIFERNGTLIIRINGSKRKFTHRDINEVISKVRWIMRIDEDLCPFYDICKGDPHLKQAIGKGRILRSPGIFEDIVKTICTTNLTWRRIVPMVGRLVKEAGSPFVSDPRYHAFPTPSQIANLNEDILKKKVKLGYRTRYILDFARSVENGELNLSDLFSKSIKSTEMYDTLRRVKGIGPFSAAYIMILLGRYEYIPIDGYARRFVSNKFLGGREASDKDVDAAFESYDKWRALAYWFYEGR